MLGPTTPTDAYIEASGSDRVLNEILENGRFGSRTSVVATSLSASPHELHHAAHEAVEIRDSFEHPARFEESVELLERRELSAVLTHTMPLEGFDRGLALLDGTKDCGKVTITMDGDG